MEFEDRLRDHLQDRTAEIHIEPEGVDVVADRVRSRRNRRTATAALAALVVVAGLTSFLVNRNADTPDQVATEGVAEEDTTNTTVPPSDEAGSADAATSSVRDGIDPDSLPDVVLPDPGSALVFTNIESDTSPGGFNVWHNGAAGDLYYVLSTSPGSTWEELETRAHFGPDTLYTWNGDRWNTGSFGDRFVTEITGGDDGILYAISTGSLAADQPAVGTSTDGGATWSWTPIEVGAEFGYDTQTFAASHDGTHLVVLHRPASADWEEAITLARDNGVDIDQETDEIFDVNSTGISWVPDVYEVSECNAAYNRYFDEQYAEYEEELFEPPISYESNLSDEDMEILRQWEEDQQKLWDERRQDAMDHMTTVPGCEEYHACLVEQFARETEIRDTDESQGVFEVLSRRAEAGEEVSEEEWIAAEEASAAAWLELEEWMEESGCRVILYGDFNEPSEADVQRISWSELGVTPPEAWKGSTDTYLLENGSLREVDPSFDSTGWLMTVRAGSGGFEVVFDETTYEPYPGGEIEEATPSFAVYSSPDGVTWTQSPSQSSEFGYEIGAGSLPDDTSFSITWAEEDRSDLVRTNADGTSDRLLLSDLAGDLDAEGYVLVGVDAGPYGVVAWASKWEDFPERAPFDEEDYSYTPNSMIFYSPDGQGWGATPLQGTDIAAAIVGRSEVMVFLADPEFNGTDTPPQPVLLGTAGQ